MSAGGNADAVAVTAAAAAAESTATTSSSSGGGGGNSYSGLQRRLTHSTSARAAVVASSGGASAQLSSASSLSSSSSSSLSALSAAPNAAVGKTVLRHQSKYLEGEKILCYHGQFIYEAKCLKVERLKSNEYVYFVHYNGWNKNWDEWVNCKRILKYNDENLKKQKEITRAANNASAPSGGGSALSSSTVQQSKKSNKREAPIATTTECSDAASSSKSSTASSEVTSSFKSKRKAAEMAATATPAPSSSSSTSLVDQQQQQQLNRRICIVDIHSKRQRASTSPPAIVLPVSLKEWLIDDFDFVMQQNKLVRMPVKRSAAVLMREYAKWKLASDTARSKANTACPYASQLNETINGLIRYFNAMLGSQLLYKFERIQYSENIRLKKPMADIYGPIHLLRLLERMNQMLFYAPFEERELDSLLYYVNDLLKYMDMLNKDIFNANDYILALPYYVRSSL